VDTLAKQVASFRKAPKSIYSLLERAKALVCHSAALLGQVIHKVVTIRPDGTQAVATKRDAQPRASPPQRVAPKATSAPVEEAPLALVQCSAASSYFTEVRCQHVVGKKEVQGCVRACRTQAT
jgi:hypothetical protein